MWRIGLFPSVNAMKILWRKSQENVLKLWGNFLTFSSHQNLTVHCMLWHWKWTPLNTYVTLPTQQHKWSSLASRSATVSFKTLHGDDGKTTVRIERKHCTTWPEHSIGSRKGLQSYLSLWTRQPTGAHPSPLRQFLLIAWTAASLPAFAPEQSWSAPQNSWTSMPTASAIALASTRCPHSPMPSGRTPGSFSSAILRRAEIIHWKQRIDHLRDDVIQHTRTFFPTIPG